jgi:hypothetical protein
MQDPRTPGQRTHDGFYDGLLMVLRCDELPDCGGIAATIVVRMTPEQYQNRAGLVTTGHGALISAELALSLLGQARIPPRWLDPDQVPRRNHAHTALLTV